MSDLREIVGYPCGCGHDMGTHDIRAMDYSEVVESAAELPCMMNDCDCSDYSPYVAERLE